MKRIALAGLLAVMVSQAGGSVVMHPLMGPLVVKHVPMIDRGIDAMPLIVAGPTATPEVAAKINVTFRRLDVKVTKAVRSCAANSSSVAGWHRAVEVTMAGPRYLSVNVKDEYACGGVQPEETFLPLVYDLTTGGTVNWLKLLPAGAASGVDSSADGSKVGAVIWPTLTAMARQQAAKGCEDVYAPGSAVPFVLWLEAKEGALKARPNELPHALAQCSEHAVTITPAQARTLGGFNEELLAMLEVAKSMQR